MSVNLFYITFTVGKGKEVLVYFLEPGEDFFLSTQTFLSPSTVVDIKGSMIIKLKWVSLLIVFFFFTYQKGLGDMVMKGEDIV